MSKSKHEPVYKLWWKLIGSIIVFPLLVLALTDGVLYIPSRHGFLNTEESPEAMGIALAVLFPLCVYSFYQGVTGLYKKFKQTGD